jgi:hypothetical protein
LRERQSKRKQKELKQRSQRGGGNYEFAEWMTVALIADEDVGLEAA